MIDIESTEEEKYSVLSGYSVAKKEDEERKFL